MSQNINKFIKQILIYIPGKIIPAIISLSFSAIFTRLFSTEEYGMYSLILAIVVIITALISQWLQQSISRYLPEVTSNDEKMLIFNSIGYGIILVVVLCFVIVLPILFGIQKLFLHSSFNTTIAAFIFILSGSIFGTLGVILQAEMKAKEYVKYNLIKEVIRFSLSIIFVMLVYRNIDSLFWAASLSGLFLIPCLWKRSGISNFRALIFINNHNRIFSYIKKFLVYGFPMVGWFIMANLMNLGDRFIIQYYRGASEVGIYSASYYLIQNGTSIIAMPILLASHPFLVKAWSLKDDKKTGEILGEIIFKFTKFSVLLAGFIILFSSEIAGIVLGAEFYEGHRVMAIIFLGVSIWQISMYTHKPMEFKEKTNQMFIIAMISTILNVLLNIAFVPTYGYMAAGYTTFSSYLFYAIVTTYLGRKHLMWKLNLKKSFFYVMIGLGYIFVLYQIKNVYLINIDRVKSGLFVLLLLIPITIFFSNDELRWLVNNFSRNRR